MPRETAWQRFWPQVSMTGDCWEWQGRRNQKGYGRFAPVRSDRGAHRVSWEMINGPIPEGMCVLHRCDNPPCVRPKHLFLGTLADNNADMKAKGRTYRPTWRGTSVPSAKLTEASVSEMRRLYASGAYTISQLAIAYGVSGPTARAAIRRQTWRHAA